MASEDPVRNLFRKVYLSNSWCDRESRSGAGSNLFNTEPLRKSLPKLLKEYNISSMIDAPCGDFHWMQHVDLKVDYLGVDVVPEMIAENIRKYGQMFICLNVISDSLPKADLIFCRDLFGHFPYEDIKKIVKNFKKSKSKYLLVTHFPGAINQDIEMGGFRSMDLCKEPFNFPKPIALIEEREKALDKYLKMMGLWKLEDLPDYI